MLDMICIANSIIARLHSLSLLSLCLPPILSSSLNLHFIYKNITFGSSKDLNFEALYNIIQNGLFQRYWTHKLDVILGSLVIYDASYRFISFAKISKKP